jgi:ABC-type bacteriocin/lantibiotic exporter with double-glycine peptidase domain
VWSVLRYHGYPVDYEDVLVACRLDPLGAIHELAIQGLQEAGWDVATPLIGDLDSMRAILGDDRPVIALLSMGATDPGPAAHAAVLCGIDGGEVVLMDPLRGEYERVPEWEFELAILPTISAALVVTGAGTGAP